MNFEEFDSGEMMLGTSVDKMSEADLLPYCVKMHQETLGFRLIVDPNKDKSILRWLRKTYGADAGRMIKLVFHEHQGYNDGETFTITWFNMAHKWWIDQIYSEVNRAKAEVRSKADQSFGIMSVRELVDASRRTA